MANTNRTPLQLRDCERMIVGNAELLAQQHHFLIGITRVRNEALILGDTLDFVGRHVDAIIAYDDASTDRTVELLRNHPKVALILANGAWESDVKARRTAEHRHRQLLLQSAREQFRFDWMFCFDADERVTGDLRGFARGPRAESCDAVSIQLFAPAVRGWEVCRMHGARGGAPEGKRNGNYKHGARSKEVIALRKFIKSLR